MSQSGEWRKSSYSNSQGTCVEWRKSSYSYTDGHCAEVATAPDRVQVRDSAHTRAGVNISPVLTVSAQAWREFTARIKAGALS